MISRVRKLAILAVSCSALLAGTTAEAGCCLFPWFGNYGCCYQPCYQSCCYQPSCCSPCSSCSTCGYAPGCSTCGDSCGCSSCGTGGCSSCGVSGCSSCGSGGCASGACGVTSLPNKGWAPSFATSPFLSPVVTVRRAPQPSVDPKFAKPAVDRRVVAPSRDLRVVPVRQKERKIQQIDLQHSANAKLRERSSLSQLRTARKVEASKRTNAVLTVSDERIAR